MISLRLTTSATAALLTLAACSSGSDSIAIPGAGAESATPAVTLAPVDAADEPDDVLSEPADEPEATTTSSIADGPEVTDPPDTTTIATTPETTAAPDTAAPATDAPATSAAPDVVYLRVGDQGDEVGLMQFKLAVLGYLPEGTDTGVFDQATKSALQRFQADYGLGVDGVFGPLTGTALNAAVQSVDLGH